MKPLSVPRVYNDQSKIAAQIAHVVKKRRKQIGINQTTLAEHSLLCRTRISQIEKGCTRGVPRIEALCALANALGMRMEIRLMPVEETA